jgi:hypothetical protein
MRDNIPLAISATVILFSFGIIVLFVAVSILEKQGVDEIELQHIDNLIDNASVIAKETQNVTKHELLQFFNKTSDVIKNNPQLQQFRQQFENITNSTG